MDEEAVWQQSAFHGVTGTAGVVGAIVFVPIAGFFVAGTSAKMPAGSGVKAYLDEDLRIGAR